MQRCLRATAILIAVAAMAGDLNAAGGCGCEAVPTIPACGCDPGPGACGCGWFRKNCGLFGHKCKGPRYEGLDAHFNCGCNGSYKFPVPPLYTYHWPGMWQQHLMTDYHSPWRFPPLKPYREEIFVPAETASDAAHPVRTASHTSEVAKESDRRPFSRRLEALAR